MKSPQTRGRKNDKEFSYENNGGSQKLPDEQSADLMPKKFEKKFKANSTVSLVCLKRWRDYIGMNDRDWNESTLVCTTPNEVGVETPGKRYRARKTVSKR